VTQVALAPAQQLAQPQYEITQADRARQKRIADAWQAFDGELPPPLRPMDGEPDDNVVGNYIEDKVEAGGNFLFGKEIEISLGEDDPEESKTFLDDTWGSKETRIPLLLRLHQNGSNAGQAFLRIVPNRDRSFRLVTLDPSEVFVKTAPQDHETVLLYCIENCDESQHDGIPTKIYYREEIARIDPQQDDPDSLSMFTDGDTFWQIQHWSREGDQGNWTPAGEPITWAYPFPPIFSNQNMPYANSFWGKPDTTKNLIALNKALNLADSNINRILKLYAGPFLYASGTGEGDLDVSPGKITRLPLPESKIEAVQLTSDLGNALLFTKRMESRIDQQSGVPGVATGREEAMKKGPMSGIAIELEFMSLIKRTDTKRCLYGKLIIDVSKALLVLAGFSSAIKVTLNWQSALPNDDTASWQAAVLAKQVGVSSTTLLRERGYDPKEQVELNTSEDAQKITNFSRGQGFPPPLPEQPPQDQQPAQPQGGQQ